jgi:hypothetical protein
MLILGTSPPFAGPVQKVGLSLPALFVALNGVFSCRM